MFRFLVGVFIGVSVLVGSARGQTTAARDDSRGELYVANLDKRDVYAHPLLLLLPLNLEILSETYNATKFPLSNCFFICAVPPSPMTINSAQKPILTN